MPATLKLIVTASLAIVAMLASLTQVQAAPYGVPRRFGHHSGHEIEHHAKRDVALIQREETTELVKITPTKSGRPSNIGAIQYTKASAIQNWRRAVIGDQVPAREEVPRSLGSHITALLSSMRHVRRGLYATEPHHIRMATLPSLKEDRS
ncbi:hypothetical protein CBOM_00266 [Ceraceosorus bombacis]|uniref:Uncharacterized protein n=1 Tax=Ceraceosorus bombacis TaxID=401625 RepID=A0A0P1B941_9BASI|nr:hypothetical protein CBOM_00266 [Ceraceosorus bombacis]